MKTDSTTKVLLGVIATGVAALTALAFERRYHNQLRPALDDLEDASEHAYNRISRSAKEIGSAARNEAHTLKDRWDDGVESLRGKAVNLKEKVSDGVERVGDHLRDGAEKLRDGLKHATAEAQEGVEDASEEAKRALAATKL